MNRLLLLAAMGVLVGIAAGCSSEGKKAPPVGSMCVLNSDCNNPLSCSFGRCHASCQESRDCPTGQRCVLGQDGVNVCQLPEQQNCAYISDCQRPLTCARDLQCRSECKEDRDCPREQRCVLPDGVCADLAELDSMGKLMNTIDGSVPASPEGTSDGGMTSPSDANVPAVVTTDAQAADGGAPADGSALAGDGPRTVPNVEILVESVTAMPAVVRQGESNVVITVTGPNLSGPGDFMLDDLKVTLEPGATDTMFKLSVTVPHGVTLGPKTLTFTTAAGRGKKENVLTVSAITAGPMGSDTMNRGSSDSPFRTFKRALQVATAGDTVHLLDGTYRVSDGETWMVPIPDKVIVEGQTAAGTQLIGPGETGGNVSVQGLTFAGDATVRRLSLAGFQYNIHVNKPNAQITLEDIRSNGARFYALYVDPAAKMAKVTLNGKEVDFSRNTNTAIYILGEGAMLTGAGEGPIGSIMSGYGMQVASARASVSLSGFTFTQSTGVRGAVYSTAAETSFKFEKVTFEDTLQISGAKSRLEMVDSTVKVNQATSYALQFSGQTMVLTRSTLEGARYNVWQNNAESEAVVRGCTFTGYGTYGYYIQSGKLDLGHATEKGNNVFVGPDTNAWALYDARQSALVPITVSNTTFNGFRPPAGKVMGPVNEPGRYRITTAGNIIEFFEL
jgi:hypothetical protein